MRAGWERAVLGVALLAVGAVAVDLPGAVVVAWVAVGLAVVGVVTDRARWQLYPAYLVMAVQPLLIALGPPAPVRIGVAVAALAVLVLSAALVAGLPRLTLPRPDGPFGVGTVATTMTAPGAEGSRRLSIRIWYPARLTGDNEGIVGEALWSELREPTGAAGALRPLTAYLDRVRTHSVRDAEAAPETAAAPVVLYHHALISFAAENTLLMEHLASHGYVVVGVRHLDQRAELAEVNAESGDPAAAGRIREINRQLAGSLARSSRAELAAELYRTNTAMATVVARRAADSRHVLDQLDAMLDLIPGGPGAGARLPVRVAAAGLSLGGAVSTELSKTDPRCVAVANLDGGLFGPNTDEPITVPYLMLYSELNSGGNDLAKNASTAEFTELTVAGAKHLDFHDATAVLPLLRRLGHLGRVPPAEMLTTRNTAVRDFLDRKFL